MPLGNFPEKAHPAMARSQETCLRSLFYKAAVFGSWMISALRRQNHQQPVFRLLFFAAQKG